MNCITLDKSILVFPIDYYALLMLSQATIKSHLLYWNTKEILQLRNNSLYKDFTIALAESISTLS